MTRGGGVGISVLLVGRPMQTEVAFLRRTQPGTAGVTSKHEGVGTVYAAGQHRDLWDAEHKLVIGR